jgi:hypothetical protein
MSEGADDPEQVCVIDGGFVRMTGLTRVGAGLSAHGWLARLFEIVERR